MSIPKLLNTVGIGVLMAFLALPSAFTQTQGGGGGNRLLPQYDPATVATVKGTVAEVKELPRGRAGGGTHVTLKTGTETLDVHLGPTRFLSKNHMTIVKGDAIEVTGSRVKYEGSEALIAREVRKGEMSLTLRDPRGIPRWSRGGR